MDVLVEQDEKTNLSDLLDRVSGGERITITRDGVPVATIVPPQVRDRRKVAEAIANIREIGRGNTLGPDLTIRDLIEEGRR